jgi:predicted TPR repeat methyltransferase
MRDMYPDADTYTAQLRALEQFVARNREQAYGHFLLAYHYLVTTNRDQAGRELQEAVRLKPDDKLSAALLRSLTLAESDVGPPPPRATGR